MEFLFNAHQNGYEYHYLDVICSPYNQSSRITEVRIREVPLYLKQALTVEQALTVQLQYNNHLTGLIFFLDELLT